MKTEPKQSFPFGEGKSDLKKCYLFRSGDDVEKLGAVGGSRAGEEWRRRRAHGRGATGWRSTRGGAMCPPAGASPPARVWWRSRGGICAWTCRRRRATGSWRERAARSSASLPTGVASAVRRQPKREGGGAFCFHLNPTGFGGFSGPLPSQNRPAERFPSVLTCLDRAQNYTSKPV
jgi:hypothetical protein